MKLPRTTPISATWFSLFFVKLATKSSSCLPRLAVGAKRLAYLPRDTGLDGAQSKDLEDAHLTPAARTFSTTEARERDLRNVDVAYGTQLDAAVLVLGPRGKTVAAPPWMRASVVEKLGAAGLS